MSYKIIFKICTLSLVILVFILFSCKNKSELKYEDFNEDDFELVPGIITKIERKRTWIARGYQIFQYNARYAFNLVSDTILTGREDDIEMVINEGEGAYILVHKNDSSISFLAGLRLTPKDEIIVERYLQKSKDSGVKYFGVK